MYLPDLLQFWSCQLISMCATACWEQLRPGRWQRKPVLTCSKFFDLSQSQTEPGKFKTTTLLYNEVSHFNKQHYQLDQYCIKISPIIRTIMLWAQICFTLWLAATKQSNALCLWSIVFFRLETQSCMRWRLKRVRKRARLKAKPPEHTAVSGALIYCIPVYGSGGVCIAWWRGMGWYLKKTNKQINRCRFHPVTLQGLPAHTK